MREFFMNKIFKICIKPAVQLLVLGVLAALLSESRFPPNMLSIIQGVIFVLSTFIALLLIFNIGKVLIETYSESLSKKNASSLQAEFMPLIRKLWAIFIILAGLMIVMKHFHYDIISLVAALGVGSLAIGLAAKDTLANMISGFTIMVDRPIRPGDRIVMNDGEMGDVVAIGLRSTKIQKMDHTLLIVPNNDLVNARITNLSYPDPRIVVQIKIGVSYESDIDQVKKCLLDEAKKVMYCLSQPEPTVYFNELGEFALILGLNFWVSSWAERALALDAFHSAIKKRFKQEGIEIPYPVKTIYVKKEVL